MPIRSFIHNREYNRIVNICSQFSIVLNSSGLKQLNEAEDILAQELLRKATEIADDEVPFYISDEEFSQVTNLLQTYSFCSLITLTHNTNMVWPTHHACAEPALLGLISMTQPTYQAGVLGTPSIQLAAPHNKCSKLGWEQHTRSPTSLWRDSKPP